MLVRRLFAVFAMVAVFSVSFASYSVNAQGASAGTCGDANYIILFSTTGAAMKSLDLTKPSAVGAALLVLIKARYQFEDNVVPAGCESAKPAVIQFLTTEEDSLYTVEAAQADTANKAAYSDAATAAATRIQTAGTAVSASFASAVSTPDANAPVGTASAAPQVCSDATFVAQVKTDTAALNGGTLSGVNIVPLIKLRYKYEDLTAPSGCEDGRTVLIQAFASVEDTVVMAVLAQADSANASTYTDFATNTINPRNMALGKTALIAFPSLAPTPAATASS